MASVGPEFESNLDPLKPHSLSNRPKSLALILGLTALLFFVASVVYVGPLKILRSVVFSLSEDTEYSEGYNERAFQEIRIGESEESVRKALGVPFKSRESEVYVIWLYAAKSVPELGLTGEYPDSRHSFTAISFGIDGFFERAFGQISHGSTKGIMGSSFSSSFGDGVNTLKLTDAEIEKLKNAQTTPEQIKERFGEPREIFKSDVVKWFQYSHSPSSTHYQQRLIGVDEDGNVCRKVAELYWD